MKILSVLMCAFIFMSMFCSVLADIEPEIVSYGFLNMHGSIISTLDAQTHIRAYADIYNKGFLSNANIGELTVSLYEGGTWQTVQSKIISVDSNTLSKRFVTDEIAVPEGEDVKFSVYLTDANGNSMPEVTISMASAGIPGAEDDEVIYAEEIKLIKALNIITGYEDGTFGGALPVTRAELAVIMTRFVGKENLEPDFRYETEYSDVGESHWACGYINIASLLGCVRGYQDGTFRPDEKVTLLYAATAFVNALGYAETVGPLGYMDKADELSITAGIGLNSSDLVSRAAMAKLIANSLEIPVLKDGIIYDGNNFPLKNMLSEVFKVTKLKVMVEELYEFFSNNKQNIVMVRVLNAYSSVYGEYGEIFEPERTVDISAGDTGLKALVGYTVIVYVAYDETSDDDPTALYVRKDISSANELTLTASDIDNVTTLTGGSYQISYRPSKNATKTEKFTVIGEADIYINGNRAYEPMQYALLDFYGTVTFVKNDNYISEDYDTVLISDYKNAVVDSVNMQTGRVHMKEGSAIIFDESNPYVSSTLYNEDGERIDWSNLKKNDILSTKTVVDSRTVNVCTLVRKSVTGVISERIYEYGESEFKIGDKYYKVDNQIVFPEDLDLNYEGTFYLDIMGRIAYCKAKFPLQGKYAYVIDSGVDSSGFDDKLIIKTFNYEGETADYTLANTVSVSEGGVMRYYSSIDDLYDILQPDTVINYGLNTKGEIDSISIPADEYDIGLNYFSKYAVDNCFDYRGALSIVRVNSRSVELSDDTVIMVAPFGGGQDYNQENYCIIPIGRLGSRDIYIENIPVQVFDVDNDMTAGLIVIGDVIDIGGEAGMAMFVGESYIDGKYSISVLQNGQHQTLTANQDLEGCCAAGDVFIPHKNMHGTVTSISKVSAVSNGTVVPDEGFIEEDGFWYAMGVVTGKSGSTVILDEDDMFSIPPESNIYIYDDTDGSVKSGCMDDFEVSGNAGGGYTYSADSIGNITSVSMVIRFYEGKPKDVALYFFGESAAQTDISVSVTDTLACAGAVYYNDRDEDINPVFVLARYSGGKMAGMVTKRVPIAANSYGLLKNIMQGSFKNGEHVKAMLLDDWNNAKPLLNTSRVDVAGLPDKEDSDYLRILSVDINSVGQINDSITITYGESGLAALSQNASIYKNGLQVGNDVTVLESFYGELELCSKNSAGEYEEAYIFEYTNTVVDSVNTLLGKVNPKEGRVISFGNNDIKSFAQLRDTEGNILDWSDLGENDILSIRTAKGTVTVNICTLVRNTVEGTITERSSETDPEFRIGGEYYKVDNQLVVPDDLDLNYEGVFYLDIFGRIAHYEAQSSLTRNYAYVIDTGIHDAVFEDRLQIKAFTFDGEVVTFTCAQNVTVIKEKAGKTSTESVYFKKDDMDDLKDLIPVDSVITFSVNSQGEINRLALPGSNSDIGLNYFARYAQGDDFDYRGNSATIRVGGKSVEISDNTIIMIAGPGFSEDDYDLLSLSVLGEEDIFEEDATTQVFDVNKNMVAGLIVVGEPISVTGEFAGLAMVSKISQIRDEDGDIINSLTLYQGGEVKEVEAEVENTPDLFSIISPRLNAKGRMFAAPVIASIQGGRIVTGAGFDNKGDVEYVIGLATARQGSRMTITGIDGNGNDVEEMVYPIPASANVYLYNNSAATNARKAMIVDSVSIFSVEDSVYYDEDGYEIDSVYALIRWYEGKIQDVVLFFDIDVELADY